jgi:hypothetical protein
LFSPKTSTLKSLSPIQTTISPKVAGLPVGKQTFLPGIIPISKRKNTLGINQQQSISSQSLSRSRILLGSPQRIDYRLGSGLVQRSFLRTSQSSRQTSGSRQLNIPRLTTPTQNKTTQRTPGFPNLPKVPAVPTPFFIGGIDGTIPFEGRRRKKKGNKKPKARQRYTPSIAGINIFQQTGKTQKETEFVKGFDIRLPTAELGKFI